MQDLEAKMPNYPSEAGTNDQPVSDPNRIPVALKVVAWIFILSGIWAAFDVLTALANGNLSINFGVLSFFIGLGLLRLSPVWRTWALIFTWFELICLPLAALLLLSGSGASTGKVLGVFQVDEFSAR